MARRPNTSALFLHVKTAACMAALSVSVLVGGASDAQAQDFMTEAELLATIPGSQLSGVSNRDNKSTWVQAYSQASSKNTGLLNGLWNKKDKYQAKWSVQNGQWCEEWDGGSGCWHLEQIDAKTLRVYADGEPLKNPWKIR